jgi:transcriptional regulator with GAF, ATPase, and Fis domain
MDTFCADDGSVLSAGALAELLRSALTRRSPEESLQAAIALAVSTAPCDHASITMLGPRRSLDTVASSDDRSGKADLLQYELDEGPALDTVRTDDLHLAEDLTRDPRWPRWAPRAVGLGIRGVIAVRLFTDTPLGTLNLYSDQPRDYDETDLQEARVVAAHTSVILAHTRTTQNLWRAIDSRTLIGQAQVILMARHQLTPEQAFRPAPPILANHQHSPRRAGRRTHPHRPPPRTGPHGPAHLS